MRIHFYIDAFNLYYGCLKGSPYKWLDLHSFCQLHFPKDDVGIIYYCTARVKSRPHDPKAPARQNAYIRAISTLPTVRIVWGHFFQKAVWMPVHPAPVHGPATVQVLKTEEKGSDVNIATHLLVDAFRGRFEKAVIVSNDSDLVGPIRIVAQELQLKVDVLAPCSNGRKPSFHLSQVASSSPVVNAAHLAAAQLPNIVTGTVRKPPEWA